MLDSTLDMIAQAASNSLLIFGLCNLIICTIIFGSKRGSYFYQESEFSMVTNECTYAKAKEGTSSMGLVDSAFISLMDTSKDLGVSGTPIPTDDNNSDNDLEILGECDSDEDADDEDELRKRVEEFIDKVNRGWKAESIRTSQSMGYGRQQLIGS